MSTLYKSELVVTDDFLKKLKRPKLIPVTVVDIHGDSATVAF